MFYQWWFWSKDKWFRCYRNKSHCYRYDRVASCCRHERVISGSFPVAVRSLFRHCRFVLVTTRLFHTSLRIPSFPRCYMIVAVYAAGSSPSIATGSGRWCRFAKLLQVWFWWSRDPNFVIMPLIILLFHMIIMLCCRIILLCHNIILLCYTSILLCFEEESKGSGSKLPWALRFRCAMNDMIVWDVDSFLETWVV